MEDLFEREQQILDEAVSYMEEMKSGGSFDFVKYALLVKEYGRLLKQLRQFTKISDRTTVDLNASKLDLIDKMHYDTLTGIFNRCFMEEEIPRIIAGISPETGGSFCVLMIDIDFFKRYNDTYGHQEGDECLRKVAGVLKETVADTDGFAARYGGEEFIAVLPDMGEAEAFHTAGKLLEEIRNLKIPHSRNDASEYVTISVGGTCGNTEVFWDAQAYISRADQALYRSKQEGRNRYTFLDMC